jgi:hypothetical protein
VHVVLATNEYRELEPRLGTLLAAIASALAPSGTLNAHNLSPGLYNLENAGFETVSEPNAAVLIARKRAPKSVPLPRRANGAAKKQKQMLWALSETPGIPPIDADALLTAEDRARPAGCEPFKNDGTPRRKKACKSCSCGLAEIEAEEATQKVTVVLDAGADGPAPSTAKVTSSCGSCYLGDAFRCASCPYLGQSVR